MDCSATSVRDKPQRRMHLPCSAWANCIKYALFMEIDCSDSFYFSVRCHISFCTRFTWPRSMSRDNERWFKFDIECTRRSHKTVPKRKRNKALKRSKEKMSWTCVRQRHAEMPTAGGKESGDEKTNRTLHVIIEIVYWKKQLFRFIHRQQSSHSLILWVCQLPHSLGAAIVASQNTNTL